MDSASFASLKRCQRGKGRDLKIISVVFLQRLSIGHDPCFHAGNHEQHVQVVNPCRLGPSISSLKVLPSPLDVLDWIFAVNEHRDKLVFFDFTKGRSEVPVGIPSRATRDKGRHHGKSAFLKKRPEAPATLNMEFLRVPSSFDVYLTLHQRVPPISPLSHNCPRRYSFSHSLSSSWFNRFRRVTPSCFWQVMTDSGDSVNPSTMISE